MELMPDIDLHHPTTIEDAINAHASSVASRYLAGGSDGKGVCLAGRILNEQKSQLLGR